MNPPPAKIFTDPLSLVGDALALVFGLITLKVRMRQKKPNWLLPVVVVLAAVCIVAGLGLAYQRESRLKPPPQVPTQSMHIDSVDQTVTNGNAITGVQGTVTVQGNSEKSTPLPKVKDQKKKDYQK